MKIHLTVKPNSRKEGVERTGENEYLIRVAAPPIGGKANEAVRRMLAAHFCVAPSRVVILKGARGRKKTAEIA